MMALAAADVFVSRWRPCKSRPQRSLRCIISYDDGTVESGMYLHVQSFDAGGFFTSPREFEPGRAVPEFWMPLPVPPKRKESA